MTNPHECLRHSKATLSEALIRMMQARSLLTLCHVETNKLTAAIEQARQFLHSLPEGF